MINEEAVSCVGYSGEGYTGIGEAQIVVGGHLQM